MNETLKVLENRRSCRKFKSDMISEEDLSAIIKAGTYAASGMGKQSPIIIAVKDKNLRDELSKENAKIAGAPEGFDYDYLGFKRLIDNNPGFDCNKMNKRQKPKKMSSSDKVKFTGDAKTKTTIDGKYSIIKERNHNKDESMFVYHIKDEIKGSYFTDENGEILSIIPYMEARELVKNL